MARQPWVQIIEKIGAGEGNRTLVISLEGCCSTVSIPFFPLHEKPVLAGTSGQAYGYEWLRTFHANTRGNVTPASPRRSSCMPTKRLTELFVARVKPPESGRVEYFDAAFPGLALRITANGRRAGALSIASTGAYAASR